MFEANEFNTIEVTHVDQVAEICLNRPDKLNSFNTEMHAELRGEWS